ncbi:hypothetical protein SGLAM104S_00602 [Streptomyces glaucescens]
MRCSSAFTRWLTADGVTCRAAAAAVEGALVDHREQRAHLVEGKFRHSGRYGFHLHSS